MTVKAMSKKVLKLLFILLIIAIIADTAISITSKEEMQTVRIARNILLELGFATTSRTSAPIVISSPQAANQTSNSINNANAVSLPIESVSATSWIVGKKEPEKYIPAKMIDGDEKTSFQFSTKTTSLDDEYIYIELAKVSDVSYLWIKNGNWNISNGKETYTLNCRLKKISLSYRYSGSNSYQDEAEYTLPDDTKRTNWKIIDLGLKKRVVGIRIVVKEIYKGTKYPNDVCISEIQVMGNVSNSSMIDFVIMRALHTPPNTFPPCLLSRPLYFPDDFCLKCERRQQHG